MGSSVRFHEIFAAEPGAATGVSFARFMELALYHPEVGYYVGPGPRIGRHAAGDFYTATSLGPLFGELVAAAASRLLGHRGAPDFGLVEIGAEPPDTPGAATGAFAGVPHPFADYRPIRLGQPIELPAASVVFSNELFDAQPCHRIVRRDGGWRELGVAWRDGALVEVELAHASDEWREFAGRLPPDAPEGYRLDLPTGSVALLRRIAALDWHGLFLAFDYGKSWRELTEATPQGTLRAYSRHRQVTNLLAQPGEQDLTSHVCWDWLTEVLVAHGFGRPVLESQEAFFTRHAGPELAAVMTAEAGRHSARKQALMHLLHPAHMGHKFQVLSALRR